MKFIEMNEIKRQVSYDRLGYLFSYEEGIFRAIYPGREQEALHLFNSGMLDELMDAGLFPSSSITDLRTSDSNLVIQHDKVPAVTLPYEWSFTMLKDAAKTVLRTNMIARKYNYQTLDAHGFNILFRYSAPLFIDLGSFVEINHEFGSSKPGWRPYGEFMKFFYAPLYMWSHGDSYLARQSIHGPKMPMSTFWRYINVLVRSIPISVLDNLEYVYYRYKGLNTRNRESFMQISSRGHVRMRIARVVTSLAKRGLLPFSSVNLEALYDRIDKIQPYTAPTKWGEYQANMQLTERHKHIMRWIDKLDIRSVLEIGGNAGFLARQILLNTCVEEVICSDYDMNAVDTLYCSLRGTTIQITPALLDIGISVLNTYQQPPQERLRSEAVFALALTHHLVLSQGKTLEFIFERLTSFASKYVFVEFMPLGCYSSQMKRLPVIPDWYTYEWFKATFSRYFKVIDESHLGENRILFIGEVHNGSVPSPI